MYKLVRLLISVLLCGLLIMLPSCESFIYKSTPNMVVIIKADDLGNMTPNWERFIHMVEKNNICASIGIITSQVTSHNSIQEIKEIANHQQINGEPIIEFWNHGYDHFAELNKTEFWGTSVRYQIKHLQKSQQFFTDSLGIHCVTFSTPFNKTSAETYQALTKSPDIDILMTAQKTEIYEKEKWVEVTKKPSKYNSFRIRLNIQFLSVSDIPLNKIKKHISSMNSNGYVVVQIHPNLWDEKDFSDFQDMIDLFKQKQVQFMTPQQYYKFLHK
ncbi:MAG: DUF2334 domain-containing protein [Paludibacteraceae bacterium]|nr:DUF2334 domain-containing protein [Paludibacteraceae bacterium]